MYNFTSSEILYKLKCIITIEPLFKSGHYEIKETLTFVNSLIN